MDHADVGDRGTVHTLALAVGADTTTTHIWVALCIDAIPSALATKAGASRVSLATVDAALLLHWQTARVTHFNGSCGIDRVRRVGRLDQGRHVRHEVLETISQLDRGV